jgi:predicted anti-sigma-YlaC factor YlaD
MRPFDCADVREQAPEFALGLLDGDTRAEVVHHIDGCPACRTVVLELAETADAMVLLAPEAEPPAGFERRVMDQITGGARRARWRTTRLVALVAAAAVIISVVTVRVVESTRSDPVAAVAMVPMVGNGGVTVGQVEVNDPGTGAGTRLAVTVDYALPDGDYRVVLAPDQAAHRVLGTMAVAGGRGAWSGSTSLPDGATDLLLVDNAGTVPCSATLPTT